MVNLAKRTQEVLSPGLSPVSKVARMRGQKPLNDEDAWGLWEMHQGLVESSLKVGNQFDSIKKEGKADRKVVGLMGEITTFIKLQLDMMDKMVTVMSDEARRIDDGKGKVQEIQSVVEEVAILHNSARATAKKAEWAAKVQKAGRQIKVFGIDFKTEVKGHSDLKREAYKSLTEKAGSPDVMKRELNRNVTIRAVVNQTKCIEEKHTAPIIIEAESRERRWAIEDLIRKEIPAIGTAYHWPQRLVEPVKKIRSAYKNAGKTMVKGVEVDLARVDLRIRPDETGNRLLVHYRERVASGSPNKFVFLEAFPSPITAEERKNNGIRDKPCTSSLEGVDFGF